MLDVLFDMVIFFGWLKRGYSILSSATSGGTSKILTSSGTVP